MKLDEFQKNNNQYLECDKHHQSEIILYCNQHNEFLCYSCLFDHKDHM